MVRLVSILLTWGWLLCYIKLEKYEFPTLMLTGLQPMALELRLSSDGQM